MQRGSEEAMGLLIGLSKFFRTVFFMMGELRIVSSLSLFFVDFVPMG